MERFVVFCQMRGSELGIEDLGIQPLASGIFDSVEAASQHAHEVFPWLKDQKFIKVCPLASLSPEEAFDIGYREGFDEGVSK